MPKTKGSKTLTPEIKAVIVRTAQQNPGKGYREIAGMTGVSLGTVSKVLKAAREQMGDESIGKPIFNIEIPSAPKKQTFRSQLRAGDIDQEIKLGKVKVLRQQEIKYTLENQQTQENLVSRPKTEQLLMQALTRTQTTLIRVMVNVCSVYVPAEILPAIEQNLRLEAGNEIREAYNTFRDFIKRNIRESERKEEELRADRASQEVE